MYLRINILIGSLPHLCQKNRTKENMKV